MMSQIIGIPLRCTRTKETINIRQNYPLISDIKHCYSNNNLKITCASEMKRRPTNMSLLFQSDLARASPSLTRSIRVEEVTLTMNTHSSYD